MPRRNSTLGLLVLTVLAVLAPSAVNAGARRLHECKETVTGTAQSYEDANCLEKDEEGNFRTVPLPVGQIFKFRGTRTSNWALSGKLAGIAVSIECTELSAEASLENAEVAKEQFEVKGSEIELELSGCKLTKPEKNCAVTISKTKGVTMITETVGGEGQVKFSPSGGGNLFEVTLSGAECPKALQGTFPVGGTLQGNLSESSPPTIEFTESTAKSLTFAGNSATLIGSLHWATKTTGTTAAFENP
jgi:hypothetical protein